MSMDQGSSVHSGTLVCTKAEVLIPEMAEPNVGIECSDISGRKCEHMFIAYCGYCYLKSGSTETVHVGFTIGHLIPLSGKKLRKDLMHVQETYNTTS